MGTSGFFDYGVDAVAPDTQAAAFLATASETDWAVLLAYGERQQVEAGDIIFELGERSRALAIVLSGQFEASLPSRRRNHRTVTGVIDAGSVLGELAFFDGAPRSARVTAASSGEVLILEWEAFERLAVARPSLAVEITAGLGRILAARFRSAASTNG